jgi:hypothetical protein
MIIKLIIAGALFSLLPVTGTTVWADGGTGEAAAQQKGQPHKRARPKKPARSQAIPVLAAAEDKFTDKLSIKGEIISVSGNNFTLRDGRGMDTVVYLFPDTAYKIEASSGAMKKGDAKMILRALMVEVEGLLNSSYQMKATVIKAKEADLKTAQALQAIMMSDLERNAGRVFAADPEFTPDGQRAASAIPKRRGLEMELFIDLIKTSMEEKRGLTIFIKGQTIAGVVTQIIGLEAIEVRNQTFSKVIIRLDAVDAMAIN